MKKVYHAATIALLFSATQCDAQNIKWRGYGKPDLPQGWEQKGNTLTRVAPAGNIITTETYENFELTLEWKLPPGGNSGVLFHVVEDPPVYENGPEMQVLDNRLHPDGKKGKTSAGANFDLYAPTRDVTKPAGQWNKAKLIVNGAHVEHWLNGVKVVEYEIGSDDWKRRVQDSKWKNYPLYAAAKTGHILLQDHDNWVSFRNIKIKRLK